MPHALAQFAGWVFPPRLPIGSRATKPWSSPTVSALPRASADTSLRRVLRLLRSMLNGFGGCRSWFLSRKALGVINCDLYDRRLHQVVQPGRRDPGARAARRGPSLRWVIP